MPDLSRRCPGCCFPPSHCICGSVTRVPSRTRVVIVRHAQERARTTNSGRWAALALARCEILDHAVHGAPLAADAIPVEDAAVLFPSPAGGPPRPPFPGTLVVLDATWSQARRMIQRIPALQRLPRISLPGSPGDRLRQPTVAGGMSTIEAIAATLRLLGDEAAATSLDVAWRLAVSRGHSLRWLDGKAPWSPAQDAAGREDAP